MPAKPTIAQLRQIAQTISIVLIVVGLIVAASPDASSDKNHEAAPTLTYEKASATGSKSTYQQAISRKELAQALVRKGPELLVDQVPAAPSQ